METQVVTSGHPVVAEVVETIARRSEEVSGKSATAHLVRDGLYARLDDWARQQHRAAGGGATLGYEQKATATALLVAPTLGDWPLWAVPNSLRETEPNVNLIIDDNDWTLQKAPGWTLGAGTPSGPVSVTAEDSGDDDVADAGGEGV